jgi:broad specificity phosphatase PhoE
MPSYFITHPEVDPDPNVPVKQWRLSDIGRARAAGLSGCDWLNNLRRIITSTEAKAVETGSILAALTGLSVSTDSELCENDRSSTGFLPAAEFEATATNFFASPNLSIRGWETAAQAQLRIVAAVRRLTFSSAASTAFVSHGGVGTLLYCDLARIPIRRSYDQPGQGSYFAFEPIGWTVRHHWRRLEPRGNGCGQPSAQC